MELEAGVLSASASREPGGQRHSAQDKYPLPSAYNIGTHSSPHRTVAPHLHAVRQEAALLLGRAARLLHPTLLLLLALQLRAQRLVGGAPHLERLLRHLQEALDCGRSAGGQRRAGGRSVRPTSGGNQRPPTERWRRRGSQGALQPVLLLLWLPAGIVIAAGCRGRAAGARGTLGGGASVLALTLVPAHEAVGPGVIRQPAALPGGRRRRGPGLGEERLLPKTLLVRPVRSKLQESLEHGVAGVWPQKQPWGKSSRAAEKAGLERERRPTVGGAGSAGTCPFRCSLMRPHSPDAASSRHRERHVKSHWGGSASV